MRTIKHLYRYPVKGLSGEKLSSVELEQGRGFPGDRVFAITNGSATFDVDSLKPEPKTSFLVLMKYAELARLDTRYDAQRKVLEVREHGGQNVLLESSLMTEEGKADIAAFFREFLGEQVITGSPKVVHRETHPFTDVSVVSPTLMHSISIINLTSLFEVEKALGKKLDPRRFRANVYFQGGQPWEEFEWMDKEITIGSIRAKVNFKTRRCPATDVNPETAERDLALPQFLRKTFGHGDLGVYAEIITPGTLKVGDKVLPLL